MPEVSYIQITVGLPRSLDSLESQISLVNSFDCEKFLKLNIHKYENVQFSQSNRVNSTPQCVVDGSLHPVQAVAKCLGY